MKTYLDTLTEHLREVAKVRTFSYDPREVEKIYQGLRKDFLDNFFRKLATKNGARYEKYEEINDYVRVSMYFGKNYISNYKLFPFHVEVADSFDKKPAEEHLEEIEASWIEQLTEVLGEDYTSQKEENDAKKNAGL